MTEVEKKDELTFSFNDNGKEHKVEELSDENRLLYNKTVLFKGLAVTTNGAARRGRKTGDCKTK